MHIYYAKRLRLLVRHKLFNLVNIILLVSFLAFVFTILDKDVLENESKLLRDGGKYNREGSNSRSKSRFLQNSDSRTQENPSNFVKSDTFYLDDDQGSTIADDGDERLQMIRSSARKTLPKALIIGVKKSGTRMLLECLKIHPDVSSPSQEVHYFSKYFHKGLDWYRRQMPPVIEGQITVERTRGYFVHRDVPSRVLSQMPNVRLIVVFRDPVTRAVFDYVSVCDKNKTRVTFARDFFVNNVTGLVDTSRGFIQTSIYIQYLEKWLEFFPLRQIHFVNGENLVKNPIPELEKLQDFLKLKRLISNSHFYFNSSRGAVCIKKYECHGRSKCFLDKTKYRMQMRHLRRLQDFFKPFNRKLFATIKQEFSWKPV